MSGKPSYISKIRDIHLATAIGFFLLSYGGYFAVQTAQIETRLSDSSLTQAVMSLPTAIVVASAIILAALQYKYSGSKKSSGALLIAPLIGGLIAIILVI
jgi:hypothetical protein